MLSLLCHGLIDKEVAERLGISLGRVRVYRKRMYKRMGHDSLLPAALVAWRTGQLDLQAIADWAIANQQQSTEDPSRVGVDSSRAPATA